MRRQATKGVIAGGSKPTVAAGKEIFEQGGNAVDAAVACVCASFVAENCLTSPGGGGFALVHDAERRENVVYDFFCAAPGRGRKAKPDPFDFKTINLHFGSATQQFYVGRASVAVPGNVAGLLQLHDQRGFLPREVVLAPAIRYAREGIPLPPVGEVIISFLREIIGNDPVVASWYKNDDGGWKKSGDLFRIPDLANTFEYLISAGADAFSRGDIARAILSDQNARGGLLTPDDLLRYRVFVRPPLQVAYRGESFLTTPLPSQGGMLIAFALKLLEERDLADVRFHSSKHLELLVEVMRCTSMARAEMERNVASLSDALPRWRGMMKKFLERPYSQRPIDVAELSGHPSTTQVSIIDEHRNAVSITTSSGETAAYVVPGTGVMLNNMMGEEDLHPEGFHSLAPGARLTSMMAPSIILEEGTPRIVLGSGGSNRLRTAILQVVSNIIDFDMSVHDAVEAARIHWERGVFEVEAGYDEDAIAELEMRGFLPKRWKEKNLFFGGVHAVLRTADGLFAGHGDSRRSGAVVIV